MKKKTEKLSRSPWQRILHIHERLQAGEYPNCIVMAGQLELAMLRRIEDVRRRAQAEVDALPLDEEMEPAEPPEPNFSGYTWDPKRSAWVQWRDGWPVGKYRMRAW